MEKEMYVGNESAGLSWALLSSAGVDYKAAQQRITGDAYAEWRIPNLLEAMSLIRLDGSHLYSMSTWLDRDIGTIWTSTPSPNQPGYYLCVNLRQGTVDPRHERCSIQSLYVTGQMRERRTLCEEQLSQQFGNAVKELNDTKSVVGELTLAKERLETALAAKNRDWTDLAEQYRVVIKERTDLQYRVTELSVARTQMERALASERKFHAKAAEPTPQNKESRFFALLEVVAKLDARVAELETNAAFDEEVKALTARLAELEKTAAKDISVAALEAETENLNRLIGALYTIVKPLRRS